MAVEDRVRMARVQRRALHTVAQLAEENMPSCLEDSMPMPQKSDEFHPASKTLNPQYKDL